MAPILFIVLIGGTSWAFPQQEITIPFPGGESAEFVWIEPGTFLMGTSDKWIETWEEHNRYLSYTNTNRIQGYEREFPQHPVTITQGFYMGKYEATRSQWYAVMEPEREIELGEGEDPIEKISVFEVQEYFVLLSEQTGLTFRLPTEAEWEYAARAGTTTLWWFGNGCGGWWHGDECDKEIQVDPYLDPKVMS